MSAPMVAGVAEGRRESTERVVCRFCPWNGQLRGARHTYKRDGVWREEVEAVSVCPVCGDELAGEDEMERSRRERK